MTEQARNDTAGAQHDGGGRSAFISGLLNANALNTAGFAFPQKAFASRGPHKTVTLSNVEGSPPFRDVSTSLNMTRRALNMTQRTLNMTRRATRNDKNGCPKH